jgi:hypothetical protein
MLLIEKSQILMLQLKLEGELYVNMSTADIIVYQLQTNSNIDYASLNRYSVHISSCDVSHLQALGKE